MRFAFALWNSFDCGQDLGRSALMIGRAWPHVLLWACTSMVNPQISNHETTVPKNEDHHSRALSGPSAVSMSRNAIRDCLQWCASHCLPLQAPLQSCLSCPNCHACPDQSQHHNEHHGWQSSGLGNLPPQNLERTCEWDPRSDKPPFQRQELCSFSRSHQSLCHLAISRRVALHLAGQNWLACGDLPTTHGPLLLWPTVCSLWCTSCRTPWSIFLEHTSSPSRRLKKATHRCPEFLPDLDLYGWVIHVPWSFPDTPTSRCDASNEAQKTSRHCCCIQPLRAQRRFESATAVLPLYLITS